ncbi:MAG: hypothetical protein C3F13_02510 [Anaerolineales bacterium]|nr:hypothetical protein [Anaerolineae bacterium]PWB56429.1 MAG: hypothetical protein C3F13_02510 [Anaerolineales bacterium]
MNIRPFGWRDWPLLRGYLNRGLFLDSARVLTQGRALIPMGAVLSYIGPSTRIYTYRCEDNSSTSTPIIGQLTCLTGSTYGRLSFLAPEDSVGQPELSLLADTMATEAGNIGAFHILAEVNESSHVVELLHRAGFAIYARQRVWRLDGQPAGEKKPVSWTSCKSKDVISVRTLYCNVVPGLVQQVEPLPKKGVKGVVYYQDGNLLAFIELKYGRNGIWVQPFIHPDAAGFERHLVHLLGVMPGRGNRPLFICIRSYQSWLDSAIEAMGAKPGTTQAVLVRHLAAALKVNQAYPVTVINGKRVEPSAPLAQIGEMKYIERAEADRHSQANL